MAAIPTDVEKPTSETREAAPPQGYRNLDIDPATERRILRKTDRTVVTLVFVACTHATHQVTYSSYDGMATSSHPYSDLLAFLDRSNIGNAQTAGMGKALGFDDAHYQVCLFNYMLPLGTILTALPGTNLADPDVIIVAVDYLLYPVQ